MPRLLRKTFIIFLILVSFLALQTFVVYYLNGLGSVWPNLVFWNVALIFSIAHAIPGWIYGLFSISKTIEAEKDNENEWIRTVLVNDKPSQFWKHVYCFHHALIYFVSSLAGFAALFVSYLVLSNRLLSTTEVNGGKAAVLIALFFFAVTGISGVLAKILWQIKKFPGIGGSGG